MSELPKLLYIVVVNDGEKGGVGGERGKGMASEDNRSLSFRYTRPVLQSTLQLMGCKARHAFKISRRVFEVMRDEYSVDDLPSDATSSNDWRIPSNVEYESNETGGLDQANMTNDLIQENVHTTCGIPFELYKRLTTAVVSWERFLDVVCDALALYKYVGRNQRADLLLACRYSTFCFLLKCSD
ncbi:unnamed protein product [Musa textilis]